MRLDTAWFLAATLLVPVGCFSDASGVADGSAGDETSGGGDGDSGDGEDGSGSATSTSAGSSSSAGDTGEESTSGVDADASASDDADTTAGADAEASGSTSGAEGETSTSDSATTDGTSTSTSTSTSDTGTSTSTSTSTSDTGTSTDTGTTETGGVACAPFGDDAHTVALWHLDDGAGQIVADSSGNGRDLQLGPTAQVEAGDPAWDVGLIDGGLSFTSAQEDYATRNGGNTFPDNELSVELWVRTTSPDYAQIFTAGFINCFVALNNNGAGLDFGIGDGMNWEILTVPLPNGTLNDGQWHYVATTYDASIMRAYVDGVQVGTQMANTTLANPGDYKLGGRPFNTFLDGDMDEVRLSDVARTADEIAAAYATCD